MTVEPRYAIYFVPGADTPLYRFGAAVLGYDCYAGERQPFIFGVDLPAWEDVTDEPRVYGFHATLKAPFRLAPGLSERDLTEVVANFAADRPGVLGGALAVRAIGAFIAVVPAAPSADIDRLAQACVREFDRFRAPMSEAERARRLASPLTPRQIEQLDRWGYPYVFDDFRFHMTLTGPLAPDERSKALQFLCEKFEQNAAARPLRIDRVVIARQADKGAPFRVMSEAVLGHTATRPYAYSC